MERIGIEERRARLAVRHHLAPEARAESVAEAVRDLVGFHATDPVTVYLSAWSRLREPSLDAIERALYEDRAIVRMLAMRRTMWVIPREDLPMVHAAAAPGVASGERRRNEQIATGLGIEAPAEWLGEAAAATLAALERLGEATAQELTREVPALRERLRVNVGKAYEGDIPMSGRVLLLLGLEGKVVRGRPRGTWVSSQYRWTPMVRWLGEEIAVVPEAEARRELIRHWLARFGPGTEGDLRWWTGWTAAVVRAALAELEAVEVDLDSERGFVLPGDLEPTPKPQSWVDLLPALDPTTMGWQRRDWYLGEHRAQLFDANGNAGPTIWVDGRIAGGWAVRANGEVVTRLLEDVGAEAADRVEAEAGRLTTWLQSTTVVPRFPGPLHRELVG
jgi:hypothetical protein